MPKEYTECVKSYVKKGIPLRESKARCAAAYFKKHGITVKEAHKQGIAELPFDTEGLDWNFVEAILDPSKRELSSKKLTAAKRPPTTIQTLIFSKPKFNVQKARNWAKAKGFKAHKVDETEDSIRIRQKEPGLFKRKSFRTIQLKEGVKAVIGYLKTAKAETFNAKDIRFEEIKILSDFDSDDNIFTLKAAKVGSIAILGNGWILSWTKEALETAAPTWAGQRVTINHEKIDTEIGIIDSHMEGDYLLMTVETSDVLADHIRKHWPEVGVSVEAHLNVLDMDRLEILSALGAGVSFLFFPKTPGCSQEEGCTIIGEMKSTIENEVIKMSDSDCSTCETLKKELEENTSLIANKDSSIEDLQKKLETNEEEINSLKAFKESTEEEIKSLAKDQIELKKITEEKEKLSKELEVLRTSYDTIEKSRKADLIQKIESAGLDVKPYESFEIPTLEIVVGALASLKEGETETSGAQETKITASVDNFDYKAMKEEEKKLLKGIPVEE